ncbi:WD40-repeat-containing domain protein [Ochromonadaceae sp. CCMP2298]|nr:WD40-repeat-containing domain protein [Ochromonadaceae sp. CCMP2298]
MSARGASARSDLFTARSGDAKTGRSEGGYNQDDMSNYAQQEDDGNPLQLEHMLGFAGNYRKTVLASPVDENVYIKSLGSLVTVENLSDPHNQIFLRGHDMPVCALAISNDGSMIASGQMGTKSFKGSAAPIFLWETRTYRRLAVLRGLAGSVKNVAFSADEMFVCGCDEDSLFYVWDLATSEVVYGFKLHAPVSVLMWAAQKKVSHHVAYEIMLGVGGSLTRGLFNYDPARMQWTMIWTPFQVPVNGSLIRQFHSIDISKDGIFVFVGTTNGEMMVFRRDTMVFRACIPVCTNGLHDLVTLPDDTVLCGGGDGALVKLRNLGAAIRSISLAANGAEAIIACASGTVFRCLARTLTYSSVSTTHTSGISCIAFPPTSTTLVFATGTLAGSVKVWDLADYSCLSELRFPKSGQVLCLNLQDTDTILSGWQDGSIRCSSAGGQVKWSIPSAHRDGTSSIAVHVDPDLQYFVSGGGDGAIRVWKYSNRELITQYTEHRKGVAKVLIDIQSPNIVHSVGRDCSVLSFDLKAARRIICHIVNSGSMVDMTQRRDNELELVTCDTLGRLLYWDIDVRDPVIAVQDPSRATIRACEISKSGRFLAFCSDDMSLKVLDSNTHEIIALGQAHSSPILALTWTPDERQIITGGEDSSLCVWNFFLGGESKDN